MNERLDYLIEVFALCLVMGDEPVLAWRKALESYAHVYHGKGGTEISRAAERALITMEPDEDEG